MVKRGTGPWGDDVPEGFRARSENHVPRCTVRAPPDHPHSAHQTGQLWQQPWWQQPRQQVQLLGTQRELMEQFFTGQLPSPLRCAGVLTHRLHHLGYLLRQEVRPLQGLQALLLLLRREDGESVPTFFEGQGLPDLGTLGKQTGGQGHV